jgi:hypothetical protein
MELPQESAKLAESALFLAAYEDRLIILDEIRRVPDAAVSGSALLAVLESG